MTTSVYDVVFLLYTKSNIKLIIRIILLF
ncbi:hypothetical protein ERE_01730 [Agathobacter rectalis M104/1]|nr:hypothetical protein ERE_01730 [Agathobacter rectalis M104/1]